MDILRQNTKPLAELKAGPRGCHCVSDTDAEHWENHCSLTKIQRNGNGPKWLLIAVKGRSEKMALDYPAHDSQLPETWRELTRLEGRGTRSMCSPSLSSEVHVFWRKPQHYPDATNKGV